MIDKPKRGRPAKVESPVSDDGPEPIAVAMPHSATVTVKAGCRWNSVQSAGVWFTKGQPVTVRLEDTGYAEWQANPLLNVEVAWPEQ